MNPAYLLVISVHESRNARKAIASGNRRAALLFLTQAYKHVGAAHACNRPKYLSHDGFIRRLNVAEAIAVETRQLIEVC